jgi:RNA polymerase sigma-70 factor (ECF subfamily)
MTDPPDPAGSTASGGVSASDREVFEGLFRAWYARLADYALSLVRNRDAAEDVVQEVFVALWRRRSSLPEVDLLPAYLHRAVRNRALNHLRHERRAGQWLAANDPNPAVEPEVEVRLEEGALADALRQALAALSPRGREVFLLSRHQGLTYQQIAHTLGISVKTVETQMGRALRALRQRLTARAEG